MSDDAAHVDRVPCLQSLGAILAALGVLTKVSGCPGVRRHGCQLGQMTDANWAELLQFLEVNLPDVPGPLHDSS